MKNSVQVHRLKIGISEFYAFTSKMDFANVPESSEFGFKKTFRGFCCVNPLKDGCILFIPLNLNQNFYHNFRIKSYFYNFDEEKKIYFLIFK